MASQQIRVEYDLTLPNSFLVDHATTDGNTRTSVYDGPDKIYLQINKDGIEIAGPLTEDDILDGRPMPADCVDWFEVDCATDPLVCQLRGPVVDELEEEYTGETVHPGSPVVAGFPQFSYGTPIMPSDLYNKDSLKVVDGAVTLERYTVPQKLLDRETELTWEEIRQKRNDALSACDSKTADGMPAALLQEWKDYRQQLRDFPATMEAASVSASIAFYMFPQEPEYTTPE